MSNKNLEEIKKLLDAAESKIQQARRVLFSKEIESRATEIEDGESDSIQGVFDGENMIGNDKKEYGVPPNYASKSKLIPGDVLKLTITSDGKYLFKQIGPIERQNVIGELEETSEGKYFVDVEGKKYQVLLASVTYFKAKPGDKLSVVIPAKEECEWAAVDNKI